MSNQLQITGGAKVRNLEGVLTGTSGVVSSLGINVPSGIPQLDGSGKILVSQLPNSVMEYKGTWDASTNTPTLVDGTGNAGDVYLCNVAGTVNFGSGPITFYVGDQVLYSGTIWQRASGASGTVSSVAVTESGDALTITGSPITTSGTINIGFAGTGSQYIKGDGTLATFPTTIDQAKRLITEVYNSTGATLSKGTVVYINGGQGNLPTITKAQANADNTSAQTYGVVQSDITNNNNGFVVVIGSLTDIDTQAYAVGTQLYLSGTTAGDWTSTKPSAPIHLVYVGIVVRSHPTQGVVEIRIQNGYELEELHDVAISAPVNNQGIFYNSSNDLWENKSIATALGYTPADDALVVHLAGTETITGVKNFDIGLTLRDGYYPTPANGYIGLASNGSGLTILTKPSATVYNHNLQFQASSNDYNFPAITGVMAMLEGTQTFSGAKTFTDNTIFSASPLFDQSANYKVGAPLVGTGNYISMAFDKSGTGSGSILSMKLADGTTAKAINLDFLGSPATYTYTFPNLTGTLALLEGTQTFSGSKTFSTAIKADSSILLKNGIQSILSGYVNIAGNTFGKGIDISYYDTAGTSPLTQVLNFSPTTSYTYTFPASSGTLALTSNLSSYVPYTGATTAVNLGSNALTALTLYSNAGIALSISGQFTGGGGYTGINGQALGIDIRPNSGGIFNLNFSSTTNRTFTFPDTSGTLVLGTGTTNYLPKFTGASTIGNSQIQDDGTSVGIGGSPNASYKLAVTGASLFSSSINSGQIQATAGGAGIQLIGQAGSNAYYVNDQAANSGKRWRFGHTGAVSGFNSFDFYNQTDDRLVMTLASGGNVGIGTNSPSARLTVYGGEVKWGFTSDLGALSYTDNKPMLASVGATDFLFYTNATERMRITSSGKVLINTTTTTAQNEMFTVRGEAAITYLTDVTRYRQLYYSGNDNFYFYNGTNNAYLSSAGAWTNASDVTIKKDIEDLQYGLNEVLLLKPRIYKMKSNDLIQVGFIAQEVEEIIPELVDEDDKGMKGLSYGQLTSVLTKALQESHQIIKELESRIVSLESKIN